MKHQNNVNSAVQFVVCSEKKGKNFYFNQKMEETDRVACRNGELISDPNFNPGAKYNVQPLTPSVSDRAEQ